MVFVTCGLGGGTGTGAAPVVAEIAQNLGCLTVAIVTKPFKFEGKKRMDYALVGLDELRKHVDTKGLMPNPKLGTVTTNVKDAVSNIKKGMVEYKNDSYGNVQFSIGKLSFDEKKLEENLRAIVAEIVKNKPAGVKGAFIKNISLSSTMSPGFKIDKASLGL